MQTSLGYKKQLRRNLIFARVIRRIHRLLGITERFSRRTYRTLGVMGSEIWALRTIGSAGSLSVADLAQRMYLQASTVRGILTRLERRGLVERNRDKSDHRTIYFSVLPKGYTLIGRVPEPPRSLIVKGLEKLNPRDLKRMGVAISQLTRIAKSVHSRSAATSS